MRHMLPYRVRSPGWRALDASGLLSVTGNRFVLAEIPGSLHPGLPGLHDPDDRRLLVLSDALWRG